MIYAKVDAQEREALQEAMKAATNTKWFLRLKLIDLSGQGYSVPELAQMFDLCAATIRRYIHSFNEGGIAGLQPTYGQGRPPELDWTKTLTDWTIYDVLGWVILLQRNFDPDALSQRDISNSALFQGLMDVFPEDGNANGVPDYIDMFEDLRWINDPDAVTYIPGESEAASPLLTAADAYRARGLTPSLTSCSIPCRGLP